MAVRRKISVLVAGAGPVGLTTALMLAKRGVQVEVIDEQWRAAARSYALALHPSSLERLDDLGLTDELMRIGRTMKRIVFYDRHEPTANLVFDELSSRFPFLLVLPQSALEEALIAKLEQLGTPVRWNRRLSWLHSDRGLPVAEIETLDKESSGYGIAKTEWVVRSVREVEASFVVGADGHRSIVRRDLEIPFEEQASSECYAVFELTADFGHDDEARVVFDDEGVTVLWPLGNGRFRFSFQVHEQELLRRQEKSRLYVGVDQHAFPHLGTDHLGKLIRARAPWFDAEVKDVVWSIGVRFENRLAESFGRGRTWLVGDAAHLGNPVGVHSMNLGIEEGHTLQQAICGVLRAGDPLQSVEGLAQLLRRPWERLLKDPTVGDGATPWVRRHSKRIARCVPASGRDLDALLAQVALTLPGD